MGKRKKESRWFKKGWDSVALFIVGTYVAYQAASKVYHCNKEELALVANTLQILEHPVCNDQRSVFQTYAGLNCDDLKHRLSETDAGRRWWSCMFSSVSILQSPTTWIAIAVCFYLLSLWLRYTNFNAHPPPPPPPQQPSFMMLPPPHFYPYPEPRRRRQSQPQMMIEQQSESSSDSDSSSVELVIED